MTVYWERKRSVSISYLSDDSQIYLNSCRQTVHTYNVSKPLVYFLWVSSERNVNWSELLISCEWIFPTYIKAMNYIFKFVLPLKVFGNFLFRYKTSTAISDAQMMDIEQLILILSSKPLLYSFTSKSNMRPSASMS